MMSGPLVNSSNQTAAPFHFHLLFYYDMAEAPSSTFNPRAHRLAPSTSILVANFIPLQLQSSFQIHPSSPQTSTLVAIQTPNPVDVLFPFFSFMAATACLMLLLPDELLTKIIIHSIKHVAIFHFLNIRNKIYGTFRHICNSDEVLLHVSLRDLHEAC
jgi:hypothetical protein